MTVGRGESWCCQAVFSPRSCWARRRADVEVLDARPRYHPSWATWVVRLPGLREIVTWNLLLVLRRR